MTKHTKSIGLTGKNRKKHTNKQRTANEPQPLALYHPTKQLTVRPDIVVSDYGVLTLRRLHIDSLINAQGGENFVLLCACAGQ